MKKFFKRLVSFLSPYSMASVDPLVAFTMASEGKALLVDSRELDELRSGMIEGAMWIPVTANELHHWVDELKKITDKKTKIFIYGNYQDSAQKLTRILQAFGFEASVIGTFESLEERLPVKAFSEFSGPDIHPMM